MECCRRFVPPWAPPLAGAGRGSSRAALSSSPRRNGSVRRQAARGGGGEGPRARRVRPRPPLPSTCSTAPPTTPGPSPGRPSARPAPTGSPSCGAGAPAGPGSGPGGRRARRPGGRPAARTLAATPEAEAAPSGALFDADFTRRPDFSAEMAPVRLGDPGLDLAQAHRGAWPDGAVFAEVQRSGSMGSAPLGGRSPAGLRCPARVVSHPSPP